MTGSEGLVPPRWSLVEIGGTAGLGAIPDGIEKPYSSQALYDAINAAVKNKGHPPALTNLFPGNAGLELFADFLFNFWLGGFDGDLMVGYMRGVLQLPRMR